MAIGSSKGLKDAFINKNRQVAVMQPRLSTSYQALSKARKKAAQELRL